MRQTEGKNAVSQIQQNLRQMRQQAQQFVQKHNSNLPPICSARHYLFHTISNTGQTCSSINRSLSHRLANTTSHSPEPESQAAQKTAVCNLQFNSISQLQSGLPHSYPRASLMNSTSLRLRMGAASSAGRYLNNPELELPQDKNPRNKIKTIIMSSQVVQQVTKDLRITNGGLSPRLAKLELNKKESQLLRKYLEKFKAGDQNVRAQQIARTVASKSYEQQHPKDSQKLQVYLPKSTYEQYSTSINRRKRSRINERTISNKKIQRQLIQKKTLDKPRYKYQLVDVECSPWPSIENLIEQEMYDFS